MQERVWSGEVKYKKQHSCKSAQRQRRYDINRAIATRRIALRLCAKDKTKWQPHLQGYQECLSFPCTTKKGEINKPMELKL